MRMILTAAAIMLPAFGWADTYYSNLPVTSATVFPQGAMVTREQALDVPAGQHQVVFALNPGAVSSDRPKFEVSEAQLISVQMNNRLPFDPELFFTPEITSATQDVDRQTDKLRTLNNTIQALEAELDAMKAQVTYLRQITPSNDTPQSFEELQSIAILLPQLLSENGQKQETLGQKIAETQRQINQQGAILIRLQQRLRDLNPPQSNWRAATIIFASDGTAPAYVAAVNFTQNAGWNISYDVDLNTEGDEVTFDRTTTISQTTSEPWVNANLTLSSAKPFQQLGPRVLGRSTVQLIHPSLRKDGFSSAEWDGSARLAGDVPADTYAEVAPSVVANAPTAVAYDGIAVEYQLSHPTTLNGSPNGSAQVVLPSITQGVVTGRYASPRMDRTAFVKTVLINTTDEPILSGNAKFYRSGNLIGNGQMPLISVGAEADLNFGPDETLPLTMQFL
ncbi:MAG: mucoidy inhibitor MuiA family protein, partial [Planktomarina sp.]